ncbi:PfkB family carbohydrate kinase [Prosthecomicrobium sp. N25]|uniref:PfkB family carbohydrate kinase n=1 Tax=Prosthecomicrobium sp. N25 TaxID=3129254 RepID=UPI003077BFD5
MAKPLKILGLGDNTVDTYVDLGLQFPGGNAVNVAVLARRLGCETAYMGCLGSDSTAAVIETALRDEDVDLARCRRRPGPNARVLIAHNEGDRRFVRSSPGVRGAWGGFDAADLAYVGSFDHVHTSIYSELGSALPAIGRVARSLSFDYSERWTPENLAATLPDVGIAFLSYPKVAEAECRRLAEDCAARGPRIVVVTRGLDGSVALVDGEWHRGGVVPTEVVDTLGAGDGFITAFLVSRLCGRTVPEALMAGAAHAASVCRYRGAFGHGSPWTSGEHLEQGAASMGT